MRLEPLTLLWAGVIIFSRICLQAHLAAKKAHKENSFDQKIAEPANASPRPQKPERRAATGPSYRAPLLRQSSYSPSAFLVSVIIQDFVADGDVAIRCWQYVLWVHVDDHCYARMIGVSVLPKNVLNVDTFPLKKVRTKIYFASSQYGVIWRSTEKLLVWCLSKWLEVFLAEILRMAGLGLEGFGKLFQDRQIPADQPPDMLDEIQCTLDSLQVIVLFCRSIFLTSTSTSKGT